MNPGHLPSFSRILLLSLLLSFNHSVSAAGNAFDQPVMHPAVPLLDEDAQHVLNSGKPYSTRMSCGNGEGAGCHDVDKISHSYHFDMGRSEADDRYGRKRGVLPVVSPGFFGGYNCMLADNPLWLSKKSNVSAADFLDFGAPGFVQTCAGCHNGGGFAEFDRNGKRYDQTPLDGIAALDGDYHEWQAGSEPTAWNWKKSGVVEPDCLLCHADFSQLQGANPAGNKTQVECQGTDCKLNTVDAWSDLRVNQLLKKGLFRYANTAILSFLDIDPGVDDKRLVSNISINGNGEPSLQWNRSAFDSNLKISMPLLRFPANDNCMLCHNTSHNRRGFYGFGPESLVEKDAAGKVVADHKDDVHKGKTWSENGEKRDIENCNACHGKQYYKAAYANVDLNADHNFLMGNSDQDVRRDLNLQPGPKSCEHCHGGKSFGSSQTPALPNSKESSLQAAHSKLWAAEGYQPYTARAVQVHFDKLACQTCHIYKLKDDSGNELKIRYRKHQAEDGLIKIMPYQATPRFYWWDKANQRMISRRERLQVADSLAPPQSYDQARKVKADLDALLLGKGIKNPDSQLVWTESNDYLLSHNTQVAKATMPCDDCHNASGGIYSAFLPDQDIFGRNNVRVIAGMADATAYQKLVDEGVVKLDMPYYAVDSKGRISENVPDIIGETDIEPFTSALRTPSQTFAGGEFRALNSNSLAELLVDDAAARTAAAALSDKLPLAYGSKIAGDKVKAVALLLGRDAASNAMLNNYRLDVAVKDWTAQSQRVNKKKVKAITSTTIKQGKLVGKVAGPLIDFSLADSQKNNQLASLSGRKLLLKLPYSGYSANLDEIALLAVKTEDDGVLVQKNPLSKIPAQIVSAVSNDYVTLLVDQLPEHVLLFNPTLKKKK